MKETTRIITMEITLVSKGEGFAPKNEVKADIEAFFKNATQADDCLVTNIQDFEMDVE